MHIFPTFIFTIIGASLAAEDSIDSSIFELDNHKNLVPLTPDSSDLIAWNDKSYPDTVSFSADENELDADLFATDCALTGRLGGRDDSGWKKSTCAADERKLKIPELPTLDDLTIPLGSNENENQGPFHEIVPTRGLLFKNDDSDVCPISKPYHLCCLCDHLFMFELCQACKPSKLASFLWRASNVYLHRIHAERKHSG